MKTFRAESDLSHEDWDPNNATSGRDDDVIDLVSVKEEEKQDNEEEEGQEEDSPPPPNKKLKAEIPETK